MNERKIAQMEGEMNSAEDKYFEARPSFDHGRSRIIFRAAFKRAWDHRPTPLWVERAREMIKELEIGINERYALGRNPELPKARVKQLTELLKAEGYEVKGDK